MLHPTGLPFSPRRCGTPQGTFYLATSFNQPLTSWQTSSVTILQARRCTRPSAHLLSHLPCAHSSSRSQTTRMRALTSRAPSPLLLRHATVYIRRSGLIQPSIAVGHVERTGDESKPACPAMRSVRLLLRFLLGLQYETIRRTPFATATTSRSLSARSPRHAAVYILRSDLV